MYFDMDTDHLLALAKVHHRAILQQAELDALWRRGVVRQKAPGSGLRRFPGFLQLLRQCWRACSLRCGTLPQRRLSVARVLANQGRARESTASRGVRACRAVE